MKLTKNTIKKLIKEEIMQEESGNMVYIVMYNPDRIPEPEAVFSTKETAEAYIQEELQNPRRRAYGASPSISSHYFHIARFEIDRYA